MNENVCIQAKNVLDKIKRLLLNYDLLLDYAKGERDLRLNYMNLNKQVKTKAGQKLYILSKVELDRFNIFIEEITKAKEELLNNLSNTLEMFEEKNHKILKKYYLENKSVDEIAKSYRRKPKDVEAVVSAFALNIISFYE